LEVLAAAARGELDGVALECSTNAAVTVVLAAAGYPGETDRGTPIAGVAEAERGGALVFHAGTARQGEQLVTNGGRVLGITGRADTVSEARDRAYEAVQCVTFAGMRYRSDIAADAEGR